MACLYQKYEQSRSINVVAGASLWTVRLGSGVYYRMMWYACTMSTSLYTYSYYGYLTTHILAIAGAGTQNAARVNGTEVGHTLVTTNRCRDGCDGISRDGDRLCGEYGGSDGGMHIYIKHGTRECVSRWQIRLLDHYASDWYIVQREYSGGETCHLRGGMWKLQTVCWLFERERDAEIQFSVYIWRTDDCLIVMDKRVLVLRIGVTLRSICTLIYRICTWGCLILRVWGDIFTKALGRERIEFLINKLGMRSFMPETLKQLADEVEE
ncbi:hypothetical protein Tco_0902538 [Tanacetum coccineum]